ncbi:arylamine N-acetyltransferase family protein [Enterococcus plantarum]|uniref:Arylamine N-acetyltransferase n=1 Tax=Enterococcus plantarum TaxID=1077675 RepID=A0A2W3Z668_9ENTE|nr:arylamine N-acetyltransferase [Enterococcus plantarum]PZL72790.1 hypothetical protein CI088_09840 [Enterococcus plantarum]
MNNETIIALLNNKVKKQLQTIAFENISEMNGDTSTLSYEYLQEKLLVRGEGGLCYDLNTWFYHKLKALNFEVKLVTGTIYDQEKSEWFAISHTHVLIVLKLEGKHYLVDIGCGKNSPEEIVEISATAGGDNYRVQLVDNEHHYLKFDGEKWQTIYKFSLSTPELTFEELTEIKKTITMDGRSPFNKKYVSFKRHETGYFLLTEKNLSVTSNGETTKYPLEPGQLDKVRGLI